MHDPKISSETARYFLIEGPPDVLAKIDEDSAYVWSGGRWEHDAGAARSISAYDGEVEAHPIDAEEAQKKDINFGSQIRSYVMAPYRLVKDLRTGVETGKVDDILDGDLDQFIEPYLLGVRRTDRVVDE